MSMDQTAPYPDLLEDLVNDLRYRPGWKFHLTALDRGQGSKGLTLDIITRGYNSHHPEQGENYNVHHYMIVPAASYNYESWRRWLFDQIMLVEKHEAMEFFFIGDEQPYAPNHGPGHDPYVVREVTTDEARRTSFRGEVKP